MANRTRIHTMIDDSILHTDDFYVSCVGNDPSKLDLAFVVNSLLGTYWGSWRTHEIIIESIRNSICFGVWQHSVDPHVRDTQVGFSRIVTDYSTFSWLADFFISPNYQKKGLGKFLIQTMVAHNSVSRRACYLSTRDKHGFYANHGFISQGDSNVMRRLPTKFIS
jgi:GNAT superfamily N-acetyltransferase